MLAYRFNFLEALDKKTWGRLRCWKTVKRGFGTACGETSGSENSGLLAAEFLEQQEEGYETEQTQQFHNTQGDEVLGGNVALHFRLAGNAVEVCGGHQADTDSGTDCGQANGQRTCE
jgi:hypothetical protein